jgi:AsmA protein
MRWVIRVLGALVLLVLIGIGLVLMVPAERVAAAATAQFERLTGRALLIEGGVKPSFWPVLGVTTGPVRIANADWSDEDAPMFAAESLTIEVNASALLGGEVRILGLRADRPVVLLERAKDGRENWVFGGGGSGGEIGAGTPGAGQPFTLEDGQITGGTIRFVDRQAGTDLMLDGVDLALKVPDYTGPFTLDATAVSAGRPVSLSLAADVFSAFAEGRVVPLKADLTAGKARASFTGRAGWSPIAAEGALSADLTDMAALAGAFGVAAPALPQGLGAQSLAVTGQLTLDGTGAVFLRGARIEADGNVIEGDLDLAPGEARPKLSAQLRAGALSLAGLSGGQGGGAGGGMEAAGWPKDRIDVSGLGVVDAAVALSAASVDLGVARLGETRVLVTVDRARAVFDIRQMAAYGGSVTGEFVVNGRGGLSVGGKLSLANLQMQPLLTDLSGWDRLIAQGNLGLRFLGVGNSVDEIMQSLEGEGNLSLGKGELRGLDIAGMLRTLDAGYVGEGQKTIFDGIGGTFAIAGGVLSNSDLKFVAPYVTATGAGEVGLGKRTLNYRLRPTALAAEDGTGGVMVPLLISGPWARPNFSLDLEAIAREKMEAEARAAEEKIKAELEKKLAEEGIVAGEGESLEDAAKRRAEEVLEDEALKLLEGLLGGN